MKKFAAKIFIYFILIYAVCFGLQFIIDSGLRKCNNNMYGIWNKIYQGKLNADIIILGSSRAVVHYNPEIIRNETGLSCYNLGVNGGKIIMQSAKYDFYLAHNKPPKVLIQNIEIMYLRKEDYIYKKEQFLPYLSEPAISSNLEIIDRNIRTERLIPLYKYRGLRTIAGLGFKSYFKFIKETDLNDHNGFIAQHKEWNHDFDKFKKMNKERIYSDDDLKIGFEIIKNLIRRCRENNIKLILVHAPMYYGLQQLIPKKDSVDQAIAALAKENNIRYWNYSKDSLSFDTKYFYNSMHLNNIGAEIFSKKLAADLLVYLQSFKPDFKPPDSIDKTALGKNIVRK